MRGQLSPREAFSRAIQFHVPGIGSHDARVLMLLQVLLPAVLGRGIPEISLVSLAVSVPRRVPGLFRVLSHVSDVARQGTFERIAESMIVVSVVRWATLLETVHRGEEITEMAEHQFSSSREVGFSAHSIQDHLVLFRLRMRVLPDLLLSSRGRVEFSRVLRPMAGFSPFQQLQRSQCTSSRSLP